MSPLEASLPLGLLTGEIRDAFYETRQELGSGFAEKVFERALAVVLRDRGLLVECSYPIDVIFRGRNIGRFEADIIVERLVLVEVKATACIEDWAKAQILNYLKCAGGGVGLLANFGPRPEIRRFVMGNPSDSLPKLSKTPIGRKLQRWTGDAATAASHGEGGKAESAHPNAHCTQVHRSGPDPGI